LALHPAVEFALQQFAADSKRCATTEDHSGEACSRPF
jgi:hypothetical protein